MPLSWANAAATSNDRPENVAIPRLRTTWPYRLQVTFSGSFFFLFPFWARTQHIDLALRV